MKGKDQHIGKLEHAVVNLRLRLQGSIMVIIVLIDSKVSQPHTKSAPLHWWEGGTKIGIFNIYYKCTTSQLSMGRFNQGIVDLTVLVIELSPLQFYGSSL